MTTLSERERIIKGNEACVSAMNDEEITKAAVALTTVTGKSIAPTKDAIVAVMSTFKLGDHKRFGLWLCMAIPSTSAADKARTAITFPHWSK
jgi:hypothetical protein